jgi:hypothetical protein
LGFEAIGKQACVADGGCYRCLELVRPESDDVVLCHFVCYAASLKSGLEVTCQQGIIA